MTSKHREPQRDLSAPRDTKALTEAEAQRLGVWMASTLGDGPGEEAIAAQRLRLASTTSFVSAPTPLRVRLWAVGGGVLAAAAVVGAVVVVGKVHSQSAASASRHPGISAEPLSDIRSRDSNRGDSNRGDSNRADQFPLDPTNLGPQQSFTWRVSPGSARTSAHKEHFDLRANQLLEATSEPVLLELSGADRTTVGHVEFGLGARVSVARVDASELALELEQGIAEAALNSKASRVVVQAGPYVVRSVSADAAAVTASTSGDTEAAAYGVQWAPRAGTLRVEVTRGEVEIAVSTSSERHIVGPGKSINLVTEGTITAALRHPKPERKLHNDARDESVAPTALEPVAAKRAPELVAAEPEPAVGAASMQAALPSPELSQWRKLAENGQYQAAVKEAERVGLASLEQTASASDLLLLADVARLGGAPQRAKSVLTSLRSRYPGHTNAAVAAFTLGRMAQEQEHDDRRAIQWYRTYLKEEPRGRMAEGARARLLKATLRVGSPAEREQAARDYLANHPTGSSAAVARSVLSK